jgi:hypothetical protein
MDGLLTVKQGFLAVIAGIHYKSFMLQLVGQGLVQRSVIFRK